MSKSLKRRRCPSSGSCEMAAKLRSCVAVTVAVFASVTLAIGADAAAVTDVVIFCNIMIYDFYNI